MSEKGTLYFFTGLAGAGKTTLGGLFYEHLSAKKDGVVLFDGDRARAAAQAASGVAPTPKDYSTEARLNGARSNFRRFRDLTEQGKDVVVCSISMYDEVREWNRANIENYVEIYIKVSMETLYRRDQKELYSSGAKNVVGIDLPWDEPKNPDFVIENDGGETPEAIVARIEEALGV